MRPKCTCYAFFGLAVRLNEFMDGLAREIWSNLEKPVELQELPLFALVAITHCPFHCDMRLHLRPEGACKWRCRSQFLQRTSIVRHEQCIDYRSDGTQFIKTTKLRKRIAWDLSAVLSPL
jgi:hypothetical protein